MKYIIIAARSFKVLYNSLFYTKRYENELLLKYYSDMDEIIKESDAFKKKHNLPYISIYLDHSDHHIRMAADHSVSKSKN